MSSRDELTNRLTSLPANILLGRPEREINSVTLREAVLGRRIFITGAGGSIGSEIARRLVNLEPAELTLLDRDESALQAALWPITREPIPVLRVLADIRDAAALAETLRTARPEVIFHAAALKHVPILENHAREAYLTNVLGTLNVLTSATACGVNTIVNVSTDKAADPVSVLGHSKRVSERLTAWYAQRVPTSRYISVRLGNVLGSRGSVLELFDAMLATSSPLPVTDPDASRYYMTSNEAVDLLLQACAIGESGDVLIPGLTEATTMSTLIGRIRSLIGTSFSTTQIGMRPGEKLTEVLIGHREDPKPHPLDPSVMSVRAQPLNPASVQGPGPVWMQLAAWSDDVMDSHW